MSIREEKELGIYISLDDELKHAKKEIELYIKTINELKKENGILKAEIYNKMRQIENMENQLEHMRTELNVVKLESEVIKREKGLPSVGCTGLTMREIRLEKAIEGIVADYEKRKIEMKQKEAQLLKLSTTEIVIARARRRHQEIMDCYHRNNGNVSKTAKELGITRKAVYQHLEKESV